MVAFESVRMVNVVARNVAEVAPAPIVIEAGTVSTRLVLESVMIAPAAGAALVKVTVQVLKESGPRPAGLQASEDTSTGATRLKLAV
jgi:sugar phosphate permease